MVAYSDGFGGGMRSGGWNGGGVSGGRGAKYGSAPARTYYGAGAGAPVGSNSKNSMSQALNILCNFFFQLYESLWENLRCNFLRNWPCIRQFFNLKKKIKPGNINFWNTYFLCCKQRRPVTELENSAFHLNVCNTDKLNDNGSCIAVTPIFSVNEQYPSTPRYIDSKIVHENKQSTNTLYNVFALTLQTLLYSSMVLTIYILSSLNLVALKHLTLLISSRSVNPNLLIQNVWYYSCVMYCQYKGCFCASADCTRDPYVCSNKWIAIIRVIFSQF